MMKAFIALCFIAVALGDVYMHQMRGSNNRLNENNQNRNNGNRLFDSQNNNQGGYNVGDTDAQNGQGVMQYYTSSILSLEWTNQHGANNPNVNTEIIFQYMCDDVTAPYDNSGLRDGTSTNRVDANDNAANGRHETKAYYDDCEARERNMGLFLADQDLDGDTAIYTRQNTNGDRNGFECPEEREYYPYWHPSPWKDIAILTSTPERCMTYISESQNVKGKNYCSNNAFNNEADCTANGGAWNIAPPHGVPAPDCVELGWSRDNHLGNTVGGETLTYNWTIPAVTGTPTCVLRIRYNISTQDYDTWNTFSDQNGEDLSPIADNPTVNFGEGDQIVSVKLAMNTDQYGRTFQDRSHKFNILPRPSGQCQNGQIYNLNVRGRRGNIVQTYPSVEYDFTPSRLVVSPEDCVHIQWTGSLNTPDGAGQGAGSTDRSNIIQMPSANHNYPYNLQEQTMFTNLDDAIRAATVGLGTNVDDELDNAPAYYNMGLINFPNPGVFHFMCTRNNNFTNRSQKGKLIVVA